MFNPTPEEVMPPDQSRNSGGPIVRRTLGTLFEGIGNVAAAGATAFDFRNQWNLREDIRTGVEIVRDQYGVNAGADTAGGSLFDYSTSPEGLQQANEEVDRLTQAYQNGTLRESYYYAQLNSLVRSVKSRYPGYEDQIDAAIADITGIDPANAYISQLRQEAMAEAGATNSMQEGLEDYIRTHEGELAAVYPGFHDLPFDEQLALVTPGNGGDLRTRVARFAESTARLGLVNNELELGEVTATEALEESIAEAQSLYMTNLNLGIEDGSLADPEAITRQLIRDGASLENGTLVEDIPTAIAYMQEQLLVQRTNLDNVLNDPRFTDADKTRAREMINDYMGTLNFYIDTIMNGETGIAAITESMMSLEHTRTYQAIDRAFGGLLTYMTVIQESMPDVFLDYVAGRNMEPLAEAAAILTGAVLDRALREAHPEIVEVLRQAGITVPPDGEIGVADIAQLVTNLADDPVEAAAMLRASMDTQLDIIRGTNGITGTPEQVASALTYLFGPERGFNFELIPLKERQGMYTLLTSPLIAQAAVAAGPEVQVAYENWAVESFRDINFQTISDLNNNLVNPAFLETFTLVFNQSTGQLEIRPNEGINFSIGRGGLPDASQPGQLFYAAYVGLRDNVDKLNQSLSDISHLFTAGGAQMGDPEFNALLPLQLNVPVQFVNEPQGLAGLTPLESPIATEEGAAEGGRTVADINAERASPAPTPNVYNPETRRFEPAPTGTGTTPPFEGGYFGATFTGGAPGTPDGQTAPTLNTNSPFSGMTYEQLQENPVPANDPKRAEWEAAVSAAFNNRVQTTTPRPFEGGYFGATFTGGAPGTPDGQPAPTLDPRAAPTTNTTPTSTVTDPTNPYANMGWDEINQLNANTLSPDARAQLQQRVTELIAQGNTAEVKNLSAESAKNISREFRNMAEKEDDAELNSRYTAISTILLEPSPELRQLRMDNYENTVITDSSSFLLGRLAPGHGDDHILEMQPVLQTNLTNFFQAAPPDIAEGLGILSGYRSVERQRELWEDALRRYGSAEVARRWVAPPGNSQHNHGNAADLTWNGQSLAHAPAWVVQWLHANAERFSLSFPLSNENWHVELATARN